MNLKNTILNDLVEALGDSGMGTRSNIAIKNDDDSYDLIYCHWDGYFSNNGVILFKNYREEEVVRKLIEGGDMSVLRSSIEDAEYYKNRGDDWEDAKPINITDLTTEEEWKLCQQEYLYLWKDGEWWGFSCHDDKPLMRLVEVLAQDPKSLPEIASFLKEETAA